MVSSANRFFLLLAALILYQEHSVCVNAQDHSWLFDIARANAESMRNYDVSYKITRLRENVENLDADKSPKWDEQRIIGRLVLDKALADKPTRLLHVRTDEFLFKGKPAQQQTEIIAWKEGIAIVSASYVPSGEISQGPRSLESVYRNNTIPFFELANGELLSPNREYWNDIGAYWESMKSKSSSLELSRSPLGALRLERIRETGRLLNVYDPISNLRISSSSFPIDPTTHQEHPEHASVSLYSWENIDNVYRLRSRSQQVLNRSVSLNEICTFHWHQFNVEEVSFPRDIFTDFSVKKSTEFLIEGQSDFSRDRY